MEHAALIRPGADFPHAALREGSAVCVGVNNQHYSDALARKLAGSDLLTPAEVATIFRVDPKTVTRWANEGKLDSIRTLGGHRRFHTAEIRERLAVR